MALRVAFDVGVDGVEPRFDARINSTRLPCATRSRAVDAHALAPRLLVDEAHVDDHRVGGVSLASAVALGPERGRLDADLGQEGVFLHRLGRQRAVEVVDQRDGLLVEFRRAARDAASAPDLASASSSSLSGLRLPLLRSTMAPCSPLLQEPLSADSGDGRKAVGSGRSAVAGG